MLDHALIAAHQVDDPLDIVRNQSRVLPWGTFAEPALVRIVRVKGFHPGAVGAFAPDKAGFRVKNMTVILRAPRIKTGVFVVTERLGHLRRTPVVVGKFQRDGNGKIVFAVRFIGRQITQPVISFRHTVHGSPQSAVGIRRVRRSGMLHAFVSCFCIKIPAAFLV